MEKKREIVLEQLGLQRKFSGDQWLFNLLLESLR
jgi:hypothetical protein